MSQQYQKQKKKWFDEGYKKAKKEFMKLIDDNKYIFIHSGEKGTHCSVEVINVDLLKKKLEEKENRAKL